MALYIIRTYILCICIIIIMYSIQGSINTLYKARHRPTYKNIRKCTYILCIAVRVYIMHAHGLINVHDCMHVHTYHIWQCL